ncbi:TetR/AcrR family transcriptional regulator [Microbacterium sp. GXF7504]
MSESAGGARERRRTETVRTLVRLARTATAEHGIHGFTVEELCESAGLSRRTFFNHFASKEDAVLGIPLHTDEEALTSAFIARGGAHGRISPTLFDDLADLAVARWRTMDIAPETARELFAAVEREPRLLARMLEHADAAARADARLIEQREGLPSGDPRAQIAATVIGALVRSATDEFLGSDRAEAFEHVFLRRIAAARDLFATQVAPTTEGPR